MPEDDATGIQAFMTCKNYVAVLFIMLREPWQQAGERLIQKR